MKGTLISILVGALAGVLLTVGSSMHASRAAASRARQVAPAQTAPYIASDPAAPPALSSEQPPVQK
jgi:hypothetical protein